MSPLATPLVTPPSHPDVDDGRAISELHRLHDVQRRAFLADPYPSAEERTGHLTVLAGMVLGHREEIRAAMSADFGAHPDLFTDLVEVLGVAGRAAYAIEHLDEWMAEEERHTEPALYGTARAGVRYQPKGVVGNIVPWNFPFDLSVGPLVEMLAAGNRAIIKPSDYTPACAELLQRMIAETFPEERVAVVAGGLALAKEFPTLRWDHLLYTGSPAIGREIARAAAENLVPVTLELGGKCPAILADDSVDATSVREVVGTKLIKNGQMCISVDYALVPRAKLEDFVRHAEGYVSEQLPGYAMSTDCTGMITERHLERIEAMLDEARAAGARIVTLGGEGDRAGRRLPLSLVVDPPKGLRIMQEEIFGPILPVVPYDDLDDALAELNAGERPLGLYVYSKDERLAGDVLRRTTSGGACVNVCASQGALPSLGFGGIGQSGYGRHHGVEGFREFSNPRGVVVRGTGDMIDAFLPPYGPAAQAIVDSVIGGEQAPKATAPGSV
ncbi:aldehyde dehydrogenase family protein [Blastococcus xanthinilyticus]|uniref:Aldehyde dehydrogenase n=1 Tax=Blastococcus xanthinilyticus TaxID=1564164 RepID=A0A5S5D3H8_9ACTN|nr:aldehyde dehydrogenase family protein [Blastococcus xanthinilyticus]TYP90511.1 coniferyl-aldehyde dehydrogenase [Blastococcus xanthinilyticus]